MYPSGMAEPLSLFEVGAILLLGTGLPGHEDLLGSLLWNVLRHLPTSDMPTATLFCAMGAPSEGCMEGKATPCLVV